MLKGRPTLSSLQFLPLPRWLLVAYLVIAVGGHKQPRESGKLPISMEGLLYRFKKIAKHPALGVIVRSAVDVVFRIFAPSHVDTGVWSNEN